MSEVVLRDGDMVLTAVCPKCRHEFPTQPPPTSPTSTPCPCGVGPSAPSAPSAAPTLGGAAPAAWLPPGQPPGQHAPVAPPAPSPTGAMLSLSISASSAASLNGGHVVVNTMPSVAASHQPSISVTATLPAAMPMTMWPWQSAPAPTPTWAMMPAPAMMPTTNTSTWPTMPLPAWAAPQQAPQQVPAWAMPPMPPAPLTLGLELFPRLPPQAAAPAGAPARQRAQGCAVPAHRRRHPARARPGRPPSPGRPRAAADAAPRQAERATARLRVTGPGAVAVDAAVLCPPWRRAGSGAGGRPAGGELRHARGGPAPAAGDDAGAQGVGLVLRGLLVAGVRGHAPQRRTGHLPGAGLLRPAVPVLAERADGPRPHQRAAALHRGRVPPGRGAAPGAHHASLSLRAATHRALRREQEQAGQRARPAPCQHHRHRRPPEPRWQPRAGVGGCLWPGVFADPTDGAAATHCARAAAPGEARRPPAAQGGRGVPVNVRNDAPRDDARGPQRADTEAGAAHDALPLLGGVSVHPVAPVSRHRQSAVPMCICVGAVCAG